MLPTLKSRLLAAVFASKVRRAEPSRRSHRTYEQKALGSRMASVPADIANAHHFYQQNYTPVAFFELRRGEKKMFVGSRDHPRTCRFCKKREPEVKFSDDAHAVSHMVGNRTLFLAEECNECNHRASLLENDFGNFTHPDRTWAQVPGKKGVPTIKTFAKRSRVDMTSAGLAIHQVEGDEIVDFDPQTSQGSFTAKATLHKYRPLGVYKALLKMALSILEEKHLDGLRPALEWIASDGVTDGAVNDVTGFTCFTSFTSGPAPYLFPTVLVMRRKHPLLRCPYMTFVLLFHNYSYQIFLPCPDRDQHLIGMRATLSMWPHPFMLRSRGHYRTKGAKPISLASAKFVERQERQMQMRFAGFREIPIPHPQ